MNGKDHSLSVSGALALANGSAHGANYNLAVAPRLGLQAHSGNTQVQADMTFLNLKGGHGWDSQNAGAP